MKISKLFHWLYCLVMFLPVLFIPIMAIYSHRHTIDTYTVTRVEPLEVSAEQFVFNGKPIANGNTIPYWDISSSYQPHINNQGELVLTSRQGVVEGDIYITDMSVNVGDYIYISFNCFNSEGRDMDAELYIGSNDFSTPLSYDLEFYNFVIEDTFGDTLQGIYFLLDDLINDENYSVYISDVQVFNLTSIFGTGNEPDKDVFKSYLVEDYYECGFNTLTIGTHNVVYDDTDIGSQFVYDTYNVVDKYFNYDKVFNFGDLYGWLQNTFFSGNAPLGFFIFWHLLIYWLLTSLLWLLFDVLIYVPQLVHRWLDKASVS